MIFFIADTHFGHANILELCDRPFQTIEEMNETMIANWNGRVGGNDTVYVVGDMFFGCSYAEKILRRLKGKKRLIIGNHDGSWMDSVELGRYFVSVDHFLEISDGKRGLTLCHYPLLTWKHEKKSYMIHGHIHADTTDDFFPLLCKRPNVLNAGVDINGFMPVTFDELVENNDKIKSAYLRDMQKKDNRFTR